MAREASATTPRQAPKRKARPRLSSQADLLAANPSERFSLQMERVLRLQGFLLVAGIDEAGRGPLAGPVVAAAVILPEGFEHPWLNDSKVLTAERRAEVAQVLRQHPEVLFAIAEATVEEIDTHNILQASLLAMRRAILALAKTPDYVLIDGRDCPKINIPGRPVVKGDAKVASIAAASILAKEARDATMVGWAQAHPQYGFEIHKGYATEIHLQALAAHGPCPIHRRSFAPVRSPDLTFF